MKKLGIFLLFAVFIFAATIFRMLDVKASDSAVPKPGAVFRDCPDCPQMVVIPAGAFTMGSSDSEKDWAAHHGLDAASVADQARQHKLSLRDFALAVADEAPQHKVSLRSFALGKYDVTRREYAAFVSETGYRSDGGCYDNGNPNSSKRASASWKNPGFKQTDNDPVICVSWDDAQAYVSWLNRKLQRSGSASDDGPYRLPTESEWEYAARARTTTRFWWGDDDAAAAAHAWYKENSGAQTHPVGLKPANRFGLYDMAGNVWQWTQDCYAETYAKASTDGSASETGKDCLRVDRGGSWYYTAWLLRPATRERNPAGYRDKVMGFRVAKTVSSAVQSSQPSPSSRVAENSSEKADRIAIERLHQQDVVATLSDKADELAKLWDNEAVRIQPGRPSEIGKAEIYANDKRWEAKPDRPRMVCYKSEIKDVRIAGEWAFEWGYISYKDSSNPKPMRGKVLRVMKRQPDGSWKFARVIVFDEKNDSAAPMSNPCQ